MRIAILGTRGIPAAYGGFETFAEQLSTRLARRGHQVTVYCRERHEHAEYRGVSLVYLPTIRHKYLDTLVHTFVSTLWLLTHRVDIALYCNAANAIFTIVPRLLGMPVALNVDGIERKRKKWNRLAKAWYLISEFLATLLPTAIVSDAETIKRYYMERYGKRSTFIPYGADLELTVTNETLVLLGLEERRYFLYVSRLEPENHALEVREAFERVETNMKLAIVGDAPYATEYISRVRDTQDPRVVLPGAIYGQGYRELGTFCFAYIQATEVGGTHPALLEAMGRGALVLYSDNPENTEVCGSAGIPFAGQEDLANKIRFVLAMSEEARDAYRARAVERVREFYSWDAVTLQYERLFASLTEFRPPH
ncbi:MAG: DUF1972 domain-containing protein [Acidobacteriota bacterium]|nr:DUF1972 domain-containing protein [Acidobacteriota bacterium]